MNEQLLDSAHEEHEVIEKRWLVPLVICMAIFAYTNEVTRQILPEADQFSRFTFHSVLISLSEILSGLALYFFRKKIYVFYAGLTLLALYSLFVPFLVWKNLNLGWTDVFIYQLGINLTLFSLTVLFFENSFPSGKKQNLFLVIGIAQGLFSNLLTFQGSEKLNPEDTGTTPFFLILALLAFAFAFSSFKRPPILNTEQPNIQPRLKKFEISVFVYTLILTVFISLQVIAVIFSSNGLVQRTNDIDKHFELVFSIITLFIFAVIFTKTKNFDWQLLSKIGILLMMISTMVNFIMIGYNLYEINDSFSLAIQKILFMGSAFLTLGISKMIYPYYSNRYFGLWLAVINVPANLTMLVLYGIGLEKLFDFFTSYALIISAVSLTFLVIIFIRLKQKPSAHEPDRHPA